MAKGNQAQNLSPDIVQLIEQLERHWVAPDDSMVSKSTYYDLFKQYAREEMSTERLRYLEGMTTYAESIAMVEEYQQSMSVGDANFQGLYPLFGLKVSPQFCFESLEQRLVVAKAVQKLRLPLIFKDGEINEENIEKMGSLLRNSFDSTSTSASFALSSNSMSCSNGLVGLINNVYTSGVADPGVCGVPNAFLGITASYLWRIRFQQISSVK
ncbi:AUGMIN subunit 4-like [Aristolochia californica]|uniref:AUGMIN subunit 4-like n=1 Tax=Aristolochia californica TaxID=171875 RepID=UPI0035D54695